MTYDMMNGAGMGWMMGTALIWVLTLLALVLGR